MLIKERRKDGFGSMNKKLITIGITLVFMIVGFSGCNDINPLSDKNKFVGTWELEDNGETGYIIFNSDNTGNMASDNDVFDFVYNINNNKLTLNLEVPEEYSSDSTEVVLEYLFISDDILRLEPLEPSQGGAKLLNRVE
jgi:hypothetical protein